ncbi:mammalian ependymin-related protein 1-like [Liolophura sinensis]|uniref:mammalian ependymin-related protein 1-like n=1 Tax=Liolophura sinensis TaxID=3198878 RepID=UPI0031592489
MMKTVLALGLFLGCVYAQVPSPCQPPDLWEARELKIDRTENYERYAKISYDNVNRRVRRIEELKIGKNTDYYDELYLHSENRFYRLNLRTRQCNMTVPPRPWHPYGIPSGATFRGENYIGASVPYGGVLVTRWSGNFDNQDYFAGAWTQPGCLPVVFDTYYNSTNEFIFRDFFDVTLGISDPMVFVPPSECQSSLKYQRRGKVGVVRMDHW